MQEIQTDEIARRKAEEILKTDPHPSKHIGWELSIAGEDFTPDTVAPPRLRSLLRVEDDGQGLALSLTARVAGNLPLSTEFEPMILNMNVGPYSTVRFKGECESPLSAEGSTEITAHTAGFWVDQNKINEQYSIIGMAPERVAFDMLNRAPYDRSLINVQSAALPLMNAIDASLDPSFPPYAAIAEPLSVLSENSLYIFRDTAYNGVTASVMAARPGTSEWTFDLGPDELEVTPPEQEEDGIYSHVIVYRTITDVNGFTEVVPLTLPMDIPGSRAPDNAWLWVEVTDDSASSIRNALIRARMEVDRRTGIRKTGIWDQRFINPFLSRGSSATVIQRDYDSQGYFVRYWDAILTAVGDEVTAESQLQVFTAELMLRDEERILPPGPRPPRRSYAFSLPRLGIDPLGRFYLDDTLPFVSIINESMVDIDQSIAASLGVDVTTDTELGAIYFDNEG